MSGRTYPPYPADLREGAVQMVLETRAERGDRVGVITDVARHLGVGAKSLRNWVKRAEIARGLRAGTSSDDRQRGA